MELETLNFLNCRQASTAAVSPCIPFFQRRSDVFKLCRMGKRGLTIWLPMVPISCIQKEEEIRENQKHLVSAGFVALFHWP